MFTITYHHVLPEDGTIPRDFYTVPPAVLRRQLDLLATRGCRAVGLEEILRVPQPPQDSFLLTFDDGTMDHFEVVFPILQERALKAVFFIPTAKLNRPGYVTDAQVRHLAAAGQIIGCHSHEHRRLDTLDEGAIREQLRISRQKLAELCGSPPLIFAPPGGYLNATVRAAALAEGLRVIRTMRWGANRRLDLTALETLPVNRRMTDAGFLRMLNPGLAQILLYTAKESLKGLLPQRGYARLRQLLFKNSGSDKQL